MENNQLIIGARAAKRLLPWWAVLPAGVLMLVLSAFGIVVPVVFNLERHIGLANLATRSVVEIQRAALPQTATEQMLALVSGFGGAYLLVWLWVRRVEKRSLRSVGLGGGDVFQKWATGFLVGGGLFAVVVGVPWAFGFFRVQGVPMQIAASLVVLVGWLVQGSAEELIFRGWMLPVLAARYNVRAGILLSAATFMVMHSFNPNLSVLAMGNLFLFGVFAALYALREGGVWGVFGMHTAWNWMQGNVLGLSVSGAPPVGDTWIRLVDAGPGWFTGGVFGPEGGLAVSAVLVVGILFLLRKWQ